jgi:LacI family transcriptional regulator
MAMGAYRAARRLGISIPDELSVVGFDNQDLLAPWLDPPLTTMQLPHYEMGRWAVEHLLRVLDGSEAEPQHRRMPCPLVPRETVVRPAGGRPIKEARSDET